MVDDVCLYIMFPLLTEQDPVAATVVNFVDHLDQEVHVVHVVHVCSGSEPD